METCEVAGCSNPAEVRSQSNKSEITATFLYCSDCFAEKEQEYPDLEKVGDVSAVICNGCGLCECNSEILDH